MRSQTILTRATEDEIGTAMSENLYSLFRSMQVLPGGVVMEREGVSYHHAFPENPMFKGVWQTRLSEDEIESEIDDAINWFEGRNAPYFFWWTDSQTQPPDLVERLLRRGFDGNLEGDPVMTLDLYTMHKETNQLNGFTARQATEPKTLLDWRDVFVAVYEMPVSGGQAWVDATLAAGGENAPWNIYIGYLDNKPVATSMLFNGAGVAGIYSIGTLPEMRHKGVGTAITRETLWEARRTGHRFAVLFSSRMGYSVYQRLGFREVPCKIGIYMFEKA
jgi:GNAT superfamily N-acetyltransferase